eukprot:12698045-Alexandrium_andersonii.AAC.1
MPPAPHGPGACRCTSAPAPALSGPGANCPPHMLPIRKAQERAQRYLSRYLAGEGQEIGRRGC